MRRWKNEHHQTREDATKADTLNIVSYNLRKHAAIGEIEKLAEETDVDVLCLQECDSTDLREQVGHLALADYTKANRLGLAIYYRSDAFELQATRLFALRKSMHDRVMAPAHERLLAAKLLDTRTDTEFLVGNFHAAPLTASNSLRRKQIATAHDELRIMGPGVATVMVGDFNYPWFQGNLREVMQETGHVMTRSEGPTYTRYKYFTGHFDFATSVHADVLSVEALPQGGSDHHPILVVADVQRERAAS
ncbi:hypothetical protein GCM10010988_27660 [Cnuibacter physcomitrellae]|uniref:endonuclease/exonuclease/phosphatase family protein n=1 Tax=Cnuibacter physcomitrellae TaxID=1619308 RepID=UPI0019CA2426|nr:endonuclease/exonuclease/phosphatase family protein [Cnuibacter physcomitrellae]MCS5497199.1 endonuclease/exonuclease/phosphatase family protein [Cnuibacter physcomitrellae]GGI40154.1 hypothetical protein GCM10010988_27660 [Cnuibacter physcomitrellae]